MKLNDKIQKKCEIERNKSRPFRADSFKEGEREILNKIKINSDHIWHQL